MRRSNRTISQEIKNYSVWWKYIADIAWIMRKTKRWIINSIQHCRIKRWWELDRYIIEKIERYRSPEQIAWVWRNKTWEKLSTKTVYTQIKRAHPELIEKYFRRKWKTYKYWTEPAWYIYDRLSIHERPESINRKEEIWHREADTMRWEKYKRWIVTLTERKSLCEMWYLVFSKDAKTITEALCKMLENMPKEIRKSITFDNWREFVNHFELKWKYWIETYFCDPWNPWQRWLNENFNWLLRQFAPKKTKWLKLTQRKVEKYIDLLNNRPRKTLNYLSPIEFLHNQCVLLK